MKYTPKEVMQFVVEEDVKFIRLTFCDIYGKQKNISIMPTELPRAFEYGIAIDASAIAGFGQDVHSDLFLHPDPDTLAIMPWRPEHGSVVRMFCSISYPDGTVFENDTRSILIKAINDAKEEGYSFDFGTEIEFYLFNLNENGEDTRIPYDNAGYMDVAPLDKGENVRREISLTLEKMGILPECSHHEEGPGQNEIDFRYSDALSSADNAATFYTVVNAIAARNGLCACFTPKPLADKPGNGLHVHMSLNGIDSKNDKALSYVIQGILDHISEMTLFLNPTEESYSRLGNFKAPKYISWSQSNRSQLVRIPAVIGSSSRAELRSPDPSANPYIVFALIIYAALEGLKAKKELQSPVDENLFYADAETLSKLKALPLTRSEAASIASQSTFIKEHLPHMLIQNFVEQ
ncbi:MAG: glutamine synthetase family protein [Lachnospiraceae bacterium]|nr:glutamine synthetase family protein [Lachnospiraceae bacterium]MDY6222506.1 glutamine synthetase family protein [Candidatus Alectryocaccobium sp.]